MVLEQDFINYAAKALIQEGVTKESFNESYDDLSSVMYDYDSTNDKFIMKDGNSNLAYQLLDDYIVNNKLSVSDIEKVAMSFNLPAEDFVNDMFDFFKEQHIKCVYLPAEFLAVYDQDEDEYYYGELSDTEIYYNIFELAKDAGFVQFPVNKYVIYTDALTFIDDFYEVWSKIYNKLP